MKLFRSLLVAIALMAVSSTAFGQFPVGGSALLTFNKKALTTLGPCSELLPADGTIRVDFVYEVSDYITKGKQGYFIVFNATLADGTLVLSGTGEVFLKGGRSSNILNGSGRLITNDVAILDPVTGDLICYTVDPLRLRFQGDTTSIPRAGR